MTQATELRELATLLDVSSNKVGIGLPSGTPSNSLVVSDGVRTSAAITAGTTALEIARTGGGDVGILINKDTAKWLIGVDNSDGNAGPLRFMYGAYNAAAHPGFGTDYSGLNLSYDGAVGIGTKTPSDPLHVDTVHEVVARFESNSNNGTNLVIANADATTGRKAIVNFAPANNVTGALVGAEATEDFSSSAARTADLYFTTRLNGTLEEKVRILSDGKVGIGTDAPVHKLDVDGAIATRQVRHSIRPTLNLDFANSKQLDPRITFYRDSIATYYDSKGVLRYANTNESRFDHDPATGESKGLLIEEAKTNIFNYTNNPEKWSLMNAGSSSPIVNSVLSPDGTMNATKLIITGGDPYFYQNGLTLNGTYTFSFWIKAFGSTVGKHYTVRGANIGTSFNIAPTGGLPSEWTRITHTFTSGSTTTAYVGIEAPDSSPANGDELSIWGAQLELGSFASSLIPSDDKFTSRSSIATYHDENGVLRTAPANSPRYGYKYDGRKWVETGLILENASTNHVGRTTNKFANPFSDGNYQIAPVDSTGETLAPDGSHTASKMVPTTGASFNYSSHYSESSAFSNGTVQVNSVYAKAGTTEFLWMSMPSTGEPNASFNLSTGAVTNITSGLFDAGMEYAGNGWWRCYIMGVVAGSPSTTAITLSVADNGVGSRQSADYLYLWGKQIETNELTSHIVNNASTGTVTRSADVASSVAYTRDNDIVEIYDAEDLIGQEQGTVFTEWSQNEPSGGFGGVFELWDSGTNGIDQRTNGSFYITNNYSISYGSLPPVGEVQKTALAYDSTSVLDSQSAINGALQGLNTVHTWNMHLTKIRLGSIDLNTAYQLNGHMARFRLYSERLTNEEIKALTEND